MYFYVFFLSFQSLLNVRVKIHTYIYMRNIFIRLKVKVYLKYGLLIKLALKRSVLTQGSRLV